MEEEKKKKKQKGQGGKRWRVWKRTGTRKEEENYNTVGRVR